MTVMYEGNCTYKIQFGYDEIVLTEAQINEIQSHDFVSNVQTKNLVEVIEELNDLKVNVTSLTEELSDQLDKLSDFDEIDENLFYETLRELKKIGERFQEIY